MGLVGPMLELAVAATLVQWAENSPRSTLMTSDHSFALTITTEDLQQIAQNYEIERVPEPHGFRFLISKSFPKEG